MNPRLLQRSLLFDSDGGGSGGGGDGGGGGSGSSSAGNPAHRDVPLDPDVLVAKYGDAQRALAKVLAKLDAVESDNADYRQTIRDLKVKVPGEDDLVLSADEQEPLRERGLLTGEGEIDVSAYDEKAERAQTADELERKENLRSVKDAAGITNFDAFEGLVNGERFEVEEGDEEKTVTVIHEEDGEEKRTPLAEYERFKPYHAALFGVEKQGKSRKGPGPPPTTSVTKKNKPGGKDNDPVGAFLEKANQRRTGQSGSDKGE